MDLPSYIEVRLRTELPQLADHLREWVEAHRSELREAGVWSDPEGTQPVRVWFVTCHTGSNDAPARIVYETTSDRFGLVTDLANGIEWYMGPYGSLADTVASL